MTKGIVLLLSILFSTSALSEDLPSFEGIHNYEKISLKKLYKEKVLDSRFQRDDVEQLKRLGYLCVLKPIQKFHCRKVIPFNEAPFDANALLENRHLADRIVFGTQRGKVEKTHESPVYDEFKYTQQVTVTERTKTKSEKEFYFRVFKTNGLRKLEAESFGALFKNETLFRQFIKFKSYEGFNYRIIYHIVFKGI